VWDETCMRGMDREKVALKPGRRAPEDKKLESGVLSGSEIPSCVHHVGRQKKTSSFPTKGPLQLGQALT